MSKEQLVRCAIVLFTGCQLEPRSARSIGSQPISSLSDGEGEARYQQRAHSDDEQHFRMEQTSMKTPNLKVLTCTLAHTAQTLRQYHKGLWRGEKRKTKRKDKGVHQPFLGPRASVRLPIACKCTADSYDLQQLYTYYTTHGMNPQIFDDVVHIEFGLLVDSTKLASDDDHTVGSVAAGAPSPQLPAH